MKRPFSMVAFRASRDLLRSFMGAADEAASKKERAKRRGNADWLARELAREGLVIRKVRR